MSGKNEVLLALQNALTKASEIGVLDDLIESVHPDIINQFCAAVYVTVADLPTGNTWLTRTMIQSRLASTYSDLCPACTSRHVNFEELEVFDSTTVSQECHCRRCDRRWIDLFKLTDVKEKV